MGALHERTILVGGTHGVGPNLYVRVRLAHAMSCPTFLAPVHIDKGNASSHSVTQRFNWENLIHICDPKRFRPVTSRAQPFSFADALEPPSHLKFVFFFSSGGRGHLHGTIARHNPYGSSTTKGRREMSAIPEGCWSR